MICTIFFCAVLYVLRGGIRWRMLQKDFPSWKLGYYYFTIWSNASGRNLQTTFVVYGIELYTFMAKVMSVGQRKSEPKRMIIECLMSNPYIVSVNFAEEKILREK